MSETDSTYQVSDRCPECGKPFFYIGDVIGDISNYICVCERTTVASGATGWSCPKCGSIYSPYTAECFRCNGSPWVTTTSISFKE